MKKKHLIVATVVALSATENGTYTAETGTAYSPVTVSVPTGAEIITRSDWDALTTAQKQAKGLVAIQDANTGYKRGEFVNGADYKPIPEIISAQSRNGRTTGSLEYTFDTAGTYQIIAVRKSSPAIQDITISINGTSVQPRYIYTSTGVLLEIYIAEVQADIGDVIATSNSTAQNNSGVQMFVLTNVDINDVYVYNSAGNAQPSFLIDTTLPYLQVAKFGYYNTNNTFEFYEINHVVKNSEYVDDNVKYYYGGSYVLVLRSY